MGDLKENCLAKINIKKEKQESEDEGNEKKSKVKKIKRKKNIDTKEVQTNKPKRFRISNKRKISEDSDSSSSVVSSKRRKVAKKSRKGRKKKEEIESESSSSSEEEQQRKKRPVIKRKNKKREEKEDTESESSSSSDGEVSPNKKITKPQSRERKAKTYTKGNEQPKKFQTGRKSSHINQTQKPLHLDDTLTESAVNGFTLTMKSVGVLVSCGDPVGTVLVIRNYRFENKNTFVNFNESPCTHHDVTFTFERLVFYDEALDVAILEVSKPEMLPKGLKLSKLNCYQLGGTRLSIIGYGHPDQHKKTLDPCCPLIEADSSRILQAQQWFETNSDYHKRMLKGTGHNPSIVDFGFGNLNDYRKFIIDCFMEKGVSGAPALIACGNNGRMKVSGLMTHGIPEFFYLLPKVVALAVFPREHRFASGTTMKAIYNCIMKENRKLANELFK